MTDAIREEVQNEVGLINDTRDSTENGNSGVVPFTAFLRQSNSPLLPTTVWQISRYVTCNRLMELRIEYRHDKITSNMKKIDWYEHKCDPNRWSQIKKVYDRIQRRINEIEEDESVHDNWVRAAKWLNTNEKKKQSMVKYISFLRKTYCSKRK